MDIKKHYKLFKAGKSWCTMAITIATLTVGFMASTNTVAHADASTSMTTSSLTVATSNQPATQNLAVDSKMQGCLTITSSCLIKPRVAK